MNVNELEPLYHQLHKRLDQLEEGYKSLEAVLHSLPLGLVVLSKGGVITLFNRCASEILKMEAVTMRPYGEVFTDDYFGCSLTQLLEKEGSQQRLFLQLGKQIELEVIATSTAEGVTLILNDRTESAKLEKTLQHNNQLHALGEMAARLAHEIRNPLGGIEGFASLLKEELVTEEHQSMARAIIDGSRALNSLVTSVLNYSKPLDLHFKKEDLVTIVKESCALSAGQGMCLSKCVTWPLLADKERLKLAFLNLIRNGWEASCGQVVTVTVDKQKVTIEDRGTGIAPEVLPHIFTPFFTTKHEGTGLGLSEAHKVIRAHGGKLELFKTSSQGSIFIVTWNPHD